ncbi:hypothetical protein G6L37_05695 [Agrobacterium rubi]|nr:hypothetical protein [Agrobacterium rubi]NTF24852.1 hypothetical protein [Agrobacterium rubi]
MEAAGNTGKKPAFDAIMLAMDAVDTLVHRENIKLEELNRDQYREVLKAKMREYNLLQGREVSDELLEAAVDEMEKGLYVYKAPKPGIELALARAYTRRGIYGRRAGLALAATAMIGVIGWSGYHFGVVAPREREVARIEQLYTVDFPNRLAVAVKDARDAAHTAGDDADLAEIDRIESSGRQGIEIRDEQVVGRAILNAETVTKSMKQKAIAALLKQQAESVAADAAKQTMDAGARKLVDAKIELLRARAEEGDGRQVDILKDEIAATLKYIRTPYTLRIVNRSGIYSYFWRFEKQDRSKRAWYLTIEAIDAAGKPASADIFDVETSQTKRVRMFAVRVPESVYATVEADKKVDGIIDKSEAGAKPSGSVDFKWAYETVNNLTITKGWEIQR